MLFIMKLDSIEATHWRWAIVIADDAFVAVMSMKVVAFDG